MFSVHLHLKVQLLAHFFLSREQWIYCTSFEEPEPWSRNYFIINFLLRYISYGITFTAQFLSCQKNSPHFWSGNIGQELKPELEPEPKLWGKVEPEPKINNFGSATLYTVHFPLSCIFMHTVISVAGPADARRPMWRVLTSETHRWFSITVYPSLFY